MSKTVFSLAQSSMSFSQVEAWITKLKPRPDWQGKGSAERVAMR